MMASGRPLYEFWWLEAGSDPLDWCAARADDAVAPTDRGVRAISSHACWLVSRGESTRAPGRVRAASDGARAGVLGRVAPMNEVTRILAAIEQGRRAGGRSAPAAGLRRAAQAGRPAARPRGARPDAPGDGAGARGVSAPGRRRAGPGLERPRPLLRRGGRGHAAHPRRERPAQAAAQARRRAAAGRAG